MTSPLLALFARSLREDSRLKTTYIARFGLVLVILLFMFTIESDRGWSNAPGLGFFSAVTTIDLICIVLAGCGYFASAITEEKEEMTLGLLRMTNLNPLSILLGKSTSRLCGALLLLAAQFPFTMLAVTLGGISLGQILAAYCTLGAFLILLANLALLASVISRRSVGAAALTVVGLVLFFAVVPALNFFAHMPAQLGLIVRDSVWVTSLEKLADFVHNASPITRLMEVLSTGFDGAPFGWQAGSNLVLGAICFVLAWAVFEVFCGEQRETEVRRGGATRRRAWLRGLSAGRVWPLALAWKDFYFLAGGKRWMLGKIAIYGTPLLVMAAWPKLWGGPPDHRIVAAITMWFSVVVFCVELAFIAASFLKIERQQKTLSSLAMLPFSMQRIALHKLIGSLPALVPAMLYFVVGLAFLLPEFFAALRDAKPPAYSNNNPRVELGAVLFLLYAVTHVLFFLVLTTNLSLRIKRGALPLAIGIDFVAHFFLSIAVFSSMRDEGTFIPLIIVNCVAIGILYSGTLNRLELLASEEN
jgi:hypothetical protein